MGGTPAQQLGHSRPVPAQRHLCIHNTRAGGTTQPREGGPCPREGRKGNRDAERGEEQWGQGNRPERPRKSADHSSAIVMHCSGCGTEGVGDAATGAVGMN